MSAANENDRDKEYLNWQEVADKFKCRKSKAMLLMHEIGVVYIGSEALVKAKDIEDHLSKYGEIKIRWPKKKTNK